MPHPRVTASRSRYQPPSSALQREQVAGAGKADAAAPTMHRAAGHRAPRLPRAASEQTKEPAGGGGPAGWEDAAGRAFALSISDASLPHTPPPQWQCPGGSSSLVKYRQMTLAGAAEESAHQQRKLLMRNAWAIHGRGNHSGSRLPWYHIF